MQGLHKFLLLHVLTCLGQNGRGYEIIDGELVPENSMLYMVSLKNKHGHVCGGFLVSERFVMTAAHCYGKNPKVLFLGYHNQQDFMDYKYIKQTYRIGGFKNMPDIMLIKLSPNAELGRRIQTVQLPTSATVVKEKQMCTVAGWGMTKPGGKIEDKLRMVNVSVINPHDCKKKHPDLPANVICTDGSGTKKGFCKGDDGGPLVCNGIAVGVASFSVDKNCTNPDAPNVYTDISKYISWIREIMKRP